MMFFYVAVDWDGDGGWTDESAYVLRVKVRSGFERAGEQIAAAGRAVVWLDNRSRRYSPGNVDSPLYGDLVPRREVKITASDGTTTWTLFRGFIDRIGPDAGYWSAKQVVITCVDAVALLAKQRVSVAHEDTKPVDEAVQALVDLVYTPPDWTYQDNGDELTHYGRAWQPEHTTALDALRDVAQAVYGRFFVARDGTVTFLTRDQLQSAAESAVASFGELMPPEYYETVVDLAASNLLAYWPLWEEAGAVIHDHSGNAHSGVAYGLTWGESGIGDGHTSALFDGVNDYGDLFSSELAAAFDPAAGTFSLWMRMGDSWNDGQLRAMAKIANSGSDITLYRNGTTIELVYNGGGAPKWARGSLGDGDWHHLAATWDTSANELSLWIDGSLAQRTVDLGTWSGAITQASLGTLGGGYYWSGNLAHVGLWDTVLSDAQIATIAEG